MHKNTFDKLSEEKKRAIKDAFYKEFSLNLFDNASVSRVVKQLGIAKGSIYQYFENKLSLYLYLMQEAQALKAEFLNPIRREDYPTFWEYMRATYIAGIDFDKKHFLESHFLFVSLNNTNSPSIKHLLDQWNKAIHIEFTKKVQYEIDLKLFHNELPADRLAFILIQNLKSIHESMKHFYGLNIEENINASRGIFSGKMRDNLLRSVDEHFMLLKKNFQ